MDANRLGRGEKIAAVSAVLLLLIMFIFSWFGIDASGGTFSASAGANAWESFGLIDLILFITAVAAIALAVMRANAQDIDAPLSPAAVVAGLGILSVVLILFRIISPPDFGVGDLGDLAGVEVGREIGVFLGLIAAAGIAYGGYEAMQERGTSFTAEKDRLTGDRDAPPPPPPPASGSAGGPPPAV